MTCQFFKKTISSRFSLEAFPNLHCFILTNLKLKQTNWSSYQKSHNNLNNEIKLLAVLKKVPEGWTEHIWVNNKCNGVKKGDVENG